MFSIINPQSSTFMMCLRYFIDSADQLGGCLMVVIPGASFLEDRGRGIQSYLSIDSVGLRKRVPRETSS